MEGLQVEANGVRLDERRFPGRQGRILFAYLAAQGERAVPRDELAQLLWGDDLPATWDKALRVLMTKLRALLEECGIDGSTALTSAFGCYRLSLPDAWIDVDAAVAALRRAEAELAVGDVEEAYAQAAAAAALARRSFLPGEDAAWVEEQRRDLHDVLVRALECLRDAALEAGKAADAVRHGEEVTVLEPFRERAYRRLMQAHIAAGDPAEALRVFDRCRRFLDDELGAYPSAETEAVYQAALQADRAAGSTVSAAPARAWHRRWPVAAAAAAVAAAAALAAWLLRDDDASARMDGDAVAALGGPSIPVGAPPSQIAAGSGALWVGSGASGSVRRVDPERGVVVQTVPLNGGVDGLATGAGSVWATSAQTGRLARISPETDAVVQTVAVPNGPRGVALGEGAVWVASLYARALTRIGRRSGRREWSRRIGGSPVAVAAGAGAVWVSDEAGARVLRVDPRSGRVVHAVGVGNAPGAITVGAGGVWVANTLDGTVARIDPGTNAVVATIPVGDGPAGIATEGDRVWVASDAGAVTEIDAAANTVASRAETGQRPVGVAVADGRVWVAARDGAAAHRGGTLRVADSDLGSTADQTEFSTAWGLNLTGDGLVAYRRAGGANGGQLVPDLAVAIPAARDGGRTWTFQVRRGIRYSNGETVGPADFRRALERYYRLGPVPVPYYDAIVGARACRRSPATCDLSRGVVADARQSTVTFRLTRPDANLLHALAIPFAHAVAPSAPRAEATRRGLPATGPYVLARRDETQLRFVRNRRFREWSRAARPDGYPDEIVITDAYVGGPAARAVATGRLDVTGLGSAAASGRLALRHPDRVRTEPVLGTYVVVLNTSRPPFDDLDARRAVALALDRRALIRAGGDAKTASVTCQILPDNFPAYEPYCPFRSAPDLRAARRLVARSGSAGARVVVETWEQFREQARIVAASLRALGYRARTGKLTSKAWLAAAYPPGGAAATVQVGLSGWIVDYLAPSTFFDQFRCGAADPATFCDRDIDRQMDAALRVQARDPEAADALWARIDRVLTDQAAWIAYGTPRLTTFLGRRVGNYQFHPVWHTLVDQLWVR